MRWNYEYGSKWGMKLYYNPSTGEIVPGRVWICMKKEEREKWVCEGRFWSDDSLVICECPTCGCWHPVICRYSTYYFRAIEKAKDCREYRKLVELFEMAPKLAKLLIDGTCTEDWVVKWVRRANPDKAMKAIELAEELYPDCGIDWERLKLEALSRAIKR